VASIGATGAGSFAGLTSTGTAGLSVQGTAGTPNVTLASLGGATANAAVPTGWDRFVLANSTGQLSQVSTSAVVALNAWALGGNAGTTNGGTLGSAPTGNFLGTTGTDAAARDLSFVTGNVIRAQISATGALSTAQDITVNGVTVGRGGGNVDSNTAVGASVLVSNTTGEANTANGQGALYSNTTGSFNTANGVDALFFNTTGNNNTANGLEALTNNTHGNNNTANGNFSLHSNITGSNNTAIGRSAGRFTNAGTGLTAVSNGVFLGYDTRALANSDTNTIVIGSDARGLGSNTAVLGSSSITATRLQGRIGIGADPTVVDGDAQLQVTAAAAANRGLVVNGAVGQSANLFEARSSAGASLFSVNAAGNTAVAGTLTVQGTLSAPGAISTTTATATTSVITPLVTSTGGLVVNAGNGGSGSSLTLRTNTVDRFVINSSGDGIFGTAANPGSLSIGTGAVAASGYKLDVGGNVKVTGDVVANGFTLTSDARLKTNIQAITDALAIVRKLQGVSYDWNRAAYPERGFSARPQIGVLAQQVEGVLPELVSTDASGFKSVNYTGFIPVLIEGMKQQADQLDAQGERLTKAEEKLGLVEERLFKAEEQFIKLDERVGKAESFVARFDTVSEPETMMVLTPTF
jgi:hypothetical protein